ncbi:inositol monophosphatase family protein [Xanthovirga aplysinae]|uniref:inositol monophosphatase family protein n=1 Tax=Xanthovirga aplysinae TaxID=2529853 RepID=UPI0012BC929A|nr:inositol monophosphatase family protein [Xanthovirga aplysinae]MTI33445.1 inositol monophosphatase [Xanthovirga aplysinae]
MINLEQLLPQVIQISKDAGAFIREERLHFDPEKVEKKGFNDLVSYVDKTAEKIIVEGLSQVLPQAGFITEEGTGKSRKEKYQWVIDPLDGTTNFVHTLPVFSVSIALIRDAQVILGVVYEINRDECFYAIEGGKAYCNETPIHVSAPTKISEALIATGFPYSDFKLLEAYLHILSDLIRTTHGLRRMGSAAIDLVYVACGRFDAYFEYNLNAWDVAAGAFIVQQAGGKVSDFSGMDNYIFGREIIATNGNIQKELLNAVKKHWLGKV